MKIILAGILGMALCFAIFKIYGAWKTYYETKIKMRIIDPHFFDRLLRKHEYLSLVLLKDTEEAVVPLNQLRRLQYVGGGVVKDVLKWGEDQGVINFGQRQAEYLVKHQRSIPKDWTGIIYFIGTSYRDRRDGIIFTPCLMRWWMADWHLDLIPSYAPIDSNSFLLVKRETS